MAGMKRPQQALGALVISLFLLGVGAGCQGGGAQAETSNTKASNTTDSNGLQGEGSNADDTEPHKVVQLDLLEPEPGWEPVRSPMEVDFSLFPEALDAGAESDFCPKVAETALLMDCLMPAYEEGEEPPTVAERTHTTVDGEGVLFSAEGELWGDTGRFRFTLYCETADQDVHLYLMSGPVTALVLHASALVPCKEGMGKIQFDLDVSPFAEVDGLFYSLAVPKGGLASQVSPIIPE